MYKKCSQAYTVFDVVFILDLTQYLQSKFSGRPILLNDSFDSSTT